MHPLHRLGISLSLVFAPLLLGGCDDPVGSEVPEFEFFEVIGEGYFPKLNDGGDVAFTRRAPGEPPVPMLYRGGQLQTLPIVGDSGCAVALNNRGDVLGYDPRPVVWRPEGTVEVLSADFVDVRVDDINDDGAVVGGVRDEESTQDGLPVPYTMVRWADPGASPSLLPIQATHGPGGGRATRFQCGSFHAGSVRVIGVNEVGDIVAGEKLLRSDGTVVDLARTLNLGATLADITDSGLILGSGLLPGGRYYAFIDATGQVHREHFPLVPRVNDFGDVAHTFFNPVQAGGPGSRQHRFHPDIRASDADPFLLDTFPEFEDQELHQLEIMDLNDRGAIALHGFRPVLPSPAMVAVYRHPALSR